MKEFDNLIKSNKVVMFTLSYCGYCKATIELAEEKGITFEIVEVDTLPDGKNLKKSINEKAQYAKYPKIYL